MKPHRNCPESAPETKLNPVEPVGFLLYDSHGY